jgi:hypothetical protein
MMRRRLRIVADGALDWNYFRENESERSLDPAGFLRLEWGGGPLVIGGEYGGSRSRQRFSPDLDARVQNWQSWGGASVQARLTGKVRLVARGEKRAFTYEDYLVDGQNVKETLDRDQLSGTGELRYALTPLTTLVLQATALRDEFRYGPPSASRVDSFRYLGGFETTDDAFVKGTLMAGVREFPEAQGAGVTAYRGPAVLAQLRIPLLGRALVAALALRDVFYAATGGASGDELLRNTYVSERYRGELLIELPLRLIGRGIFDHEDARFLIAQPGLSERRDRIRTFGGGLQRQFGNLLRIGVGVDHVRRDSSYPGYSYEGFRYGIQGELVP